VKLTWLGKMLKRTIVLLVVALASAVGADEESSLRIDASSEAAFETSLGVFKDALSPEQLLAFGDALKDVWLAGTQQRHYTARDYYRQIDGLSYEEVVALTTGEAAKQRALSAAATEPSSPAARARAGHGSAYERSPWEGVPPPPPASLGVPQAGISSLSGPSLQQ